MCQQISANSCSMLIIQMIFPRCCSTRGRLHSMAEYIDRIKKMMGWCSNTTPVIHKSMQHVEFVNPSQTPSDRSNIEHVQSKNIMFSANNTLSTLCFVMGFNLTLQLSTYLNYVTLIPTIVATYSFFYLIAVKTSQARVSIDENGVHLTSFMFKNITLDYKDIKSVTPKKPMKSIKLSNKMIVILAIPLTFLVALFTYPMVVDGHWQWIMPVALLLPGSLFCMYKQDRRYHELDAQSVSYTHLRAHE